MKLKFDKNVGSPLKPLQDDVSDSNLGPFKVATQLDLNPSMSNLSFCTATGGHF